ncbi:hypothetical protein Sjap_014916 [Stephania japonica]|uniref:Uncharacterized protein n=1 Tax=Stephania japonica TaxID=461633 RepID=A0AAP0II64_9MAGN
MKTLGEIQSGSDRRDEDRAIPNHQIACNALQNGNRHLNLIFPNGFCTPLSISLLSKQINVVVTKETESGGKEGELLLRQFGRLSLRQFGIRTLKAVRVIIQLKVEFVFDEKPEEEYSDEEEFVSKVLFLYGDVRRIDPIFFEEESKNFNEAPKFDSDGYNFVEDKIVFGEVDFVIEVVSLFKVPQVLEEVVGDTGVSNEDNLSQITSRR